MGNLPQNRIHKRIVYLDNDETTEPCKVIDLFFDACLLPEHLDTIRGWRDDLTFGTDYTKKKKS
ncbi:hypothetical protein CA265_11860 [Sphingobacteriaceae bacterium GW460-11-11-14-LB5]|nr:hypothetical protein CA265_11860 [Sphingobacteriaceae bacterium GW460-11-11-14-LB5]